MAGTDHRAARELTLLPAAARPAGSLSGDDQRRRRQWPIVLVSMPFMEVNRPSIQLGLLKSLAEEHGFAATTVHANLDFATLVEADVYDALCQLRGRLLGDWLFSVEAFGTEAPDSDGRLLEVIADELERLCHPVAAPAERLRHIRTELVPQYLDKLLIDVPWHRFKVVGFTSTFQQNAASFALARRLKERYPGLVTIFGGSNFDGEMGPEFVRSIDVVDLAVLGEADTVFPRLLEGLADGLDVTRLPGVGSKRTPEGPAHGAVAPVQLDRLPTPDYGEYFDRAEALGLLPQAGHRDVWVPFESARGCWWGQKHHCTFCGLNGSTITFRSKSPGRVVQELAELARSTRSFRFFAVDNILDYRYFDAIFPALQAEACDYELFYEVKANLTRQQLQTLARGGVHRIQPGIESLSSHVLALMRKGVNAAQNINTIKWAQYYGIDIAWNLIWGFPGESEEDYAQQVELIGRLTHLQPPGGMGRIWMERFSPVFTDREAFPATRLQPELSYSYVYPSEVNLDRAAYFFDYDLEHTLPDSAFAGLQAAIEDWHRAWAAAEHPTLRYWSAPGFLQIHDARNPDTEGTYTFRDELAAIYRACSDRPVGARRIRERLGLRYSVPDIEAVLREFADRGLMFLDGDLAVSLALPAVGGR